jgi:hypothetical protein
MNPRWPVLRALLLAAPFVQAAVLQPTWAQVQTTVVATPPALPDDGKPPHDDSPVICRPGQRQSGSRLMTPPVCKTQRQWDDLHARGLDLAADGKSTFHTSPRYNSTEIRVCRNSADCAP